MIAGGESIKRLVANRIPMQRLYADFESLDRQFRYVTSEGSDPTITLGKRKIKLFKQSGEGWSAYSRTATLDDGRCFTVQMIYYSSFSFTARVRHELKVFGCFSKTGQELALVKENILPVNLPKTKDALVEGALRAVYGQEIELFFDR